MRNQEAMPISSQPQEIWKPVPGCPDYLISNQGNVMSLRRKTERLLKPYKHSRGHRITIYTSAGKLKAFRLMHLMMLAFKPIPNAKVHHVVPKDNDPFNISLNNLEWQPYLHGAQWRPGSNNPRALLTDAQVAEIRHLYKQDMTQTHAKLAARYGVGCSTIGGILRGNSWKHIDTAVMGAHS
jgi:hypothetical protein